MSKDEKVIRHMHTHLKMLFPAIFLSLLLIILAGVVVFFIPTSWPSYIPVIVGGVAAVLLIPVFIIPFFKWYSNTYTITTKRIITRTGILNKKGHDLPLGRISNVSYDASALDRVFGCGTLILETSADDPLSLVDLPHIERVHVEMADLLFGTHDATLPEGRGDGVDRYQDE